MKRRRKYDRQFKIEAVRLVMYGNRKATEVARDLGINVNQHNSRSAFRIVRDDEKPDISHRKRWATRYLILAREDLAETCHLVLTLCWFLIRRGGL